MPRWETKTHEDAKPRSPRSRFQSCLRRAATQDKPSRTLSSAPRPASQPQTSPVGVATRRKSALCSLTCVLFLFSAFPFVSAYSQATLDAASIERRTDQWIKPYESFPSWSPLSLCCRTSQFIYNLRPVAHSSQEHPGAPLLLPIRRPLFTAHWPPAPCRRILTKQILRRLV